MKIKLSLLIIILSVFCATTSFAHPYDLIIELKTNCKRFIDESSKSEFPLYGLEMTVMNYTICTKPEIMKNLSSAEKSHLKELALKIEKTKSSLSPEQSARIKEYDDYVVGSLKILKDAVAPQDLSKLTKQEMAELDKNLKAIFWKMTDALKNNDIDKALSYFSDYSKDKHRKMFKVLSPEAIQEVIRDTKEITFTTIRGDSVHYEIITTHNGEKFLYPLDFVQDLDGKWKILNY